MPKVTIDYTKCSVKKVCMEICPMGVFEMEDDKMVAKYQDKCIVCRACEANCPEGAITVTE